MAREFKRSDRVAQELQKEIAIILQDVYKRQAELHHYRFYLENIEYQGKIQGLRAVIEL